tara:strand:- start:403 stop:663 length:261 start_codon:yes stop_codon:yes gene_type:complete
MALSDDEKKALEYAILIGPLLNQIAIVADLPELSTAGRALSKVPVEQISRMLATLRTDVFHIQKGTIKVGKGVKVKAKDTDNEGSD